MGGLSKQEAIKNIVVFGANGGIGSDVVRRLSEAVADGKPYKVTIVSRKDEGFSVAQLQELKEAFPKGKIKSSVDLEEQLQVGPVFNPNDTSNLQDVLKDADMVICAAGVPRPSPTPKRRELIYPNARIAKSVAEAVAKYCEKDAPLLLGTNPLDNTVQIADEALREGLKKAGKNENLHVVFGMAGTLDEARLRIYAARLLNEALGKESKIRVKAQDVDGAVYGQHGDKMVIDMDSVTIAGVKLQDFIVDHELQDKKVTLVTPNRDSSGRRITKETTVREAIEEATKDGGASISAGLGRTTQIGGAGQIFGMIEDYFSDKPKTINACVVSGFMDDKEKLGYCRPIEIGGGKVTLKDFPDSVSGNTGLRKKISESREVIKTDNEYYKKCVEAEKRIIGVVGNRKLSIVRDESPDPKIKLAEAKDLKVEITGIDSQSLASIKDDFVTINGATNANVVGGKLSFVIKSNSTAPLDSLAEVLGSKVQQKPVGRQNDTPSPSSDILRATAIGGMALGGMGEAHTTSGGDAIWR